MLLLSKGAVLSQPYDRTLAPARDLPRYPDGGVTTSVITLWSGLDKSRPLYGLYSDTVVTFVNELASRGFTNFRQIVGCVPTAETFRSLFFGKFGKGGSEAKPIPIADYPKRAEAGALLVVLEPGPLPAEIEGKVDVARCHHLLTRT